MNVEYDKQTFDTPNPIARFAHLKRLKLSLNMVDGLITANQVLLDYGCGKGRFLEECARFNRGVRLLGFDPESGHSSEAYRVVTDIAEVERGSVDVFCSFETLEHLFPLERKQLYDDARRVLKTSGVMVISVPVIGGPTLLLKEFNRAILFKRQSDYGIRELLKAAFLGVPAPPPANPRITHKGFDYRTIAAELDGQFSVRERFFSPFSWAPWYLNSQVFFLCGLR